MRKTLSLFIAIVLILVTLGILMLASASSVEDDSTHFWKRQLIWLVLSFCVACVAARFDYRFYRKLAIPASVFSVLLLILVRIPGIGHNINGSWRWLKIGGLTVQPSEIAKLAMIMLFAWWIAFFPGSLLSLTLVCFSLLADGLRDALDPKALMQKFV